MKREILFKAKRIDNGEWVEGLVAKHPKSDGGVDFYYITKSVGKNMVEVDPKTVCQYTGLKDKNGVKIFEGDQVSFEDFDNIGENPITSDGEVFWFQDELCFSITNRETVEMEVLIDDTSLIEVTGNIHDND